MNKRINIAIADRSAIIRNGLISILKRLSIPNIDVVEIEDISLLERRLAKYKLDILIINPLSTGIMPLKQIATESCCKNLKYIALQSSLTDITTLNAYDEIISIYDTADMIKEKLMRCYSLLDEQHDIKQDLSSREKEIIVGVAKGMTNKQIADRLYLSLHTVTTHRRNIANKLQIHSSAGLTIYAIVNKLVELDDIKDTIAPED